MSILIKDMEMPKSCKSCDLLQDYDGDMYCPLNDYLNFGDIENVPDYVMIGCPLSAQPEYTENEEKVLIMMFTIVKNILDLQDGYMNIDDMSFGHNELFNLSEKLGIDY